MHTKAKILLIEDDINAISVITASLTENGYQVISASTGVAGLSLAASHCPDVILLNLGLPDMDGYQVLKMLRKWSRIPVIVISALTIEQAKVTALDMGADDYITKPFGTAELMARIRTALRHTHMMVPTWTYRALNLELDFERRVTRLEGQDVHLTQKEYQLLALLAQHSGSVLTYHFIMNTIWGPYKDNNNQILRVNMANIRRKIEKNPAQPQYIFTEAGIGYRMREAEKTDTYLIMK